MKIKTRLFLIILVSVSLMLTATCSKTKTDKADGNNAKTSTSAPSIPVRTGPRKVVAKTPPMEFFEKIIKTSESGKALFDGKTYKILDFGSPYKYTTGTHFPFLVQFEGAPAKMTFELVKDTDGKWSIREQKLLPKHK